MNERISLRAGAGALAGTLMIATLAAGCSGDDGAPGSAGTGTPTAPATAAAPANELEQQYERVVQTVLPSIVQVETDGGEGSGVVYDGNGHIVTNAHVVAGARQIRVTPASGGQPLEATLLGSFAPDDLAVLKVSGGNLPAASFRSSADLRIGQIVLAMGNPLGLTASVTNGIVSALNRTVSTAREGAFPGSTIADAIQTSAAINPGNSGGALVTLDGKVVGIPTAAARDPQAGAPAPGIGFATPSDTVRLIVPQLIQSGKVTNSGRAALGVTVRSVLDLGSGRPAGVEVVEVGAGGGADKAGIQPGDVIVAVNGTPTPTQSALSEALATLKPGQNAKVEVQRGSGRQTFDVTLGQLSGD